MGDKYAELKRLFDQNKNQVSVDREGRLVPLPESKQGQLVVRNGQIIGPSIGTKLMDVPSAAK